ncbi:lysozyme [Pleurocapsa sp. FMAR1]|uniref:lysozyme n=1 Tax=Pleurocapsa sp. FMAR1 TaxID=3040204 RepID=UPI0029C74011|nr:lysozyme [Pleurocapsa sp. FMAR1]
MISHSHLEAERLLKEDLSIFEKAVTRFVTVPLNQNQFDALVSFTFNVGVGAFSKSTLLKLLNYKDYQKAANEFSRWTRGGGRILPGLINRRKDEHELFVKQ